MPGRHQAQGQASARTWALRNRVTLPDTPGTDARTGPSLTCPSGREAARPGPDRAKTPREGCVPGLFTATKGTRAQAGLT